MSNEGDLVIGERGIGRLGDSISKFPNLKISKWAA